MRALLVFTLVLFALFCLYAVIHFHTIAAISSAEQLPRVTYNRNFWLGLFILAVMGALVALRWRRRGPPD